MNSKTFKRVIVVLLVTAIAVALPSSFAKYIGQESYTMTVKNKLSFFYNTSSAMTGGKVLLPYAGRYAIIVKGGDGSNANTWNGSTDSGFDIQGGIGGTVVGVYVTTEANQYVYVAPGGAGERPYLSESGYGKAGSAGVNLMLSGKFNGGEGDNISQDTIFNIGTEFSKQPSSGGGGAASVVYKCDSNGNFSSSDLLFVAGGGGAAASWNEGYSDRYYFIINGSTTASGTGGSATGNLSNFMQSDNYACYVIENGSFVLHKVFCGEDGTGNSSTLGVGGGYVAPGRTASVSAVARNFIPAASAGSGSMYSNGGNGGNGKYYGGGGGAGYAGGGGGAGTSISVAAGGGGAGSSFISYIITQESVDYAGMISEASNSATCYDGKPIPTQYPLNNNTAEGNGYVIVKYLGSGGTLGTKTTKSLSAVMNEIVSASSSYKSKTITQSSTSDALYIALMENECVEELLYGRAWEISTDKNGKVTIKFTENRSTTIGSGTKFWRYVDGTWSQGTAYRKYSWNDWEYPNSWDPSSTGYQLT